MSVGSVVSKNFAAPILGARFTLLILLGASIAVGAACQKANAADWDHAPDGRVIISIKGNKFLFPSSGDDLDSIHFNSVTSRSPTLRDVLASPDAYREMFAKDANVIITAHVRDRGGLYLDRFDRNALGSVGFSFEAGDNQRNCNSWAKAFNRAKAEDPKDQKSEYGWRESVTAGIEKIYTREHPAGIQSLYCNNLGYCGSSICLLPNLTFVLRFSTAIHPKDRWADLLNRVEDVLSYVLPGQPISR